MTRTNESQRRPAKGRRLRFADLIKDVKARQPLLPVLHTVGSSNLRSIVENDRLLPALCPQTGEEVVFASYGKPQFQQLDGCLAPGSNLFAPVVLLFDPELIQQAARIYPFDSLAAMAGRMAPLVADGTELDEFELRTVRTAPSRVIRAFYGTNYRYLIDIPSPDPTVVKRNAVRLAEYADWLAACKEADRFGATTIELQIDEEIVLSEQLRAIILPTALLSDRIVADFLLAYRISVMSYTFFGGEATAYAAGIRQLVAEHSIALGLARHD